MIKADNKEEEEEEGKFVQFQQELMVLFWTEVTRLWQV